MMRIALVRMLTAAFLISSVASAQPAMDVQTLVHGLQKRQDHFKSIAGRVVVGRKALTVDKAGPQPSLTVVDFARRGESFRIEQREVIVPTLRWTLAYGALLHPDDGGKPVEPRQLYVSFVCDGSTTWQYDRSLSSTVGRGSLIPRA